MVVVAPLSKIRNYLDDLKQQDKTIRIHGNGFIQIDVAQYVRIHIWSPDIPAQQIYTGIHDHRADFASMVLYGQLTNRIYKPNLAMALKQPADAAYRVYQAVPTNRFDGDEDTKLVASDFWALGSMNPITEDYPAGRCYFFDRYAFHETFVRQLTITQMIRMNIDPDHKPRVMVPVGKEPSNEFDKHGIHAETIWKLVFALIDREIKRTSPKTLQPPKRSPVWQKRPTWKKGT